RRRRTFGGLETPGASQTPRRHGRLGAARALGAPLRLGAPHRLGIQAAVRIQTQGGSKTRAPQRTREGGHPEAGRGPGQSPAQIQGQRPAFFPLAHRTLEDHQAGPSPRGTSLFHQCGGPGVLYSSHNSGNLHRCFIHSNVYANPSPLDDLFTLALTLVAALVMREKERRHLFYVGGTLCLTAAIVCLIDATVVTKTMRKNMKKALGIDTEANPPSTSKPNPTAKVPKTGGPNAPTRTTVKLHSWSGVRAPSQAGGSRTWKAPSRAASISPSLHSNQ
uniref:Uncharacterized protein n=1 Tax=Sus scrofa TaxID=9823 RepID=A0A8D0PZV7_PIG